MILTCPSCGTQYVVKDGAIPDGGRQVRCASCKHSWHQDPEPVSPALDAAQAEAEPSPEAAPDASQVTDNDLQEQFASERVENADTSATDQVEDAPASSAEDEDTAESHHRGWFAPPEDDFAPFGQRDDVVEERRRGPWLKILGLIVTVALLAAAFWFLAPAEWKSRIGLSQGESSPLQLMLTHSQRQELASGNVLLAVTGRVINPTDTVQNVPPIQAELRKTSGEIVHSWTIAPPARSIPPGGRAPFNSAEMNVPADGDLLTITFRETKA
jgi:predicted Zn finger-like uncharacterized protein